MKSVLLSLAGVACVAVVGGRVSDWSSVRQARAVHADASAEVALQMPSHVRQIMSKACNNCHTYETKWPWYSRIVPMNWLIEYDVSRARKAVNYSEWSSTVGRRAGSAMGMLAAACQDVQIGRMPPVQYRLMHPESKLSAQEVGSLCVWTQAAMRRIKSDKLQGARRVSTSFH